LPNLDPKDFSIICDPTFCKTLHETAATLQKGQVSKSKWEMGWAAIEHFVEF
jgi:hypothetical protein